MKELFDKVIKFLTGIVLKYYNHPAVVDLYIRLAYLYTNTTETKVDDIFVEKLGDVLKKNYNSDTVKLAVVDVLRELSKETDNGIDDYVVLTVERLMNIK
jgi:hypothetical protein